MSNKFDDEEINYIVDILKGVSNTDFLVIAISYADDLGVHSNCMLPKLEDPINSKEYLEKLAVINDVTHSVTCNMSTQLKELHLIAREGDNNEQ